MRAHLPQEVQQPAHFAQVVEGGPGGGPVGQRGDLIVRAGFPQAVQQGAHAARVVERDVGGGPRGGLLDSLLVRALQPQAARLPQAVQQGGHAVRVVEGDVGNRIPMQQRGLRARPPQVGQQMPTRPGSSRAVWAAAQCAGRGSARRQAEGWLR